jgi:hypothetical protein
MTTLWMISMHKHWSPLHAWPQLYCHPLQMSPAGVAALGRCPWAASCSHVCANETMSDPRRAYVRARTEISSHDHVIHGVSIMRVLFCVRVSTLTRALSTSFHSDAR